MMLRPQGGAGMRPGGAGGAAGFANRRPMGGGGFMGLSVPVERSKDFKGTLRKLVARLRPERATLLLVVVLGSISVALSVIGPKIAGNAMNVIFDGVIGKQLPAGVSKDQLIAALRARGQDQFADLLSSTNVVPGVGIDFTLLGQILVVAVAVYALSSLFAWAQAYLMAGVAQRTVFGLRRDAEAKLARLPLSYFDSHAHGDLLSRVTNDIDNIATTLQQGLSQLLTSFLTVIGVLGMMLWISPILALIAVGSIPLSFAVTIVVAGRSQKEFIAQWAETGALNGHVEQMHSGHMLVQVFGRMRSAIEQFNEQNERLYRAAFRAQFLSGMIQPAVFFIGNLNYVGVAVIGGYRVATGAMTLGDVTAFIAYSRQFTMPLTQIAAQANLLQSGLASAERVFEFLAAPEETADRRPARELAKVAGHVQFKDVSFRYLPDKPLIEDFSLDVRPGEAVAIVGPTGAGKTTIVNLLMRFYDIDGGEILLDGVETRDLPRDTVRRAFGMVLQDSWLFAGTIRDNIAYGKAGAAMEEIVAAATAAHVDPFVRTLPEGYDTKLEEDATNISAGQKQLITIARAFLADPSILILDEATSNVDTRTEVLIQQAMTRLRHGRTSFVIAHRLSTIRNADEIVVMDKGRIVEQGTHDQLLTRHGFYAGLYESQFAETVGTAAVALAGD
ncbi:MAG: ABC transporter ATP-binding protein [Chloroflexi bacterium]|nr:MAG: ABC transporter ATP-binding protein [Chloroflexota bacterium]